MPTAPPADPYPDFPQVENPDKSTWDKRGDGSDKGMGWLGLRKRPDGDVSSEISVGVEIDGKEVELPLMVPGLTAQEMRHLMTTPPKEGQAIPPTIMRKAVDFARQRIADGKSPFRQPDEPMQLQASDPQSDLLKRMYASKSGDAAK